MFTKCSVFTKTHTSIVCRRLCAHVGQQVKPRLRWDSVFTLSLFHHLLVAFCAPDSTSLTHAETSPAPRNVKSGKGHATYCARHKGLLSGEQYKQKQPYFQPEHAQEYPFKTLLEANQRKHEDNGGFSPEPAARCPHTAPAGSRGCPALPSACPRYEAGSAERAGTPRLRQRGLEPRPVGAANRGISPEPGVLAVGLPIPGKTPRSRQDTPFPAGLLPPGRGWAGPCQAGAAGAPGAVAVAARPCGSAAPRPGSAGRALPPLSPVPVPVPRCHPPCPYSHPRLRRAAQGSAGPGSARRGAGTRQHGRGR